MKQPNAKHCIINAVFISITNTHYSIVLTGQCKPNFFVFVHDFSSPTLKFIGSIKKHSLTIHTPTPMSQLNHLFFPLAMNYCVVCATPASTNHPRQNRRHPSQKERKKITKEREEEKKKIQESERSLRRNRPSKRMGQLSVGRTMFFLEVC